MDTTLADILLELETITGESRQGRLQKLSQQYPHLAAEMRVAVARIDHVDRALNIQPFELPDLPGFEQITELGVGGMGRVYRAYDAQLQRFVAIKVPKSVALSRADISRFKKEARTLASLRHPNVVSLYSGQVIDHRPYFVMEYVKGGTLAHHRCRFSKPADAADILVRIAKGLSYAHGKGILHLDLKPSNILIGDDGQPLIADFGIAKWAQSDTEAEQPFGTLPPAASSETMTAGDADIPSSANLASDILSLGNILQYLLRHQRNTRSSRPKSAPSALATIVRRATDSKCANRFQSVDEFATALARWLTKHKRRRQRLLLCVATVTLGIVAFGVWLESTFDATYRMSTWGKIRSLQSTGSIVLIADSGDIDSYRVFGDLPARATIGSGAATFFSQGLSLVELLPEVSGDTVEITCEVRDLGSHNKNRAGVGIYVAGRSLSRDEYVFASVYFSDSTQSIQRENRRVCCGEWMHYVSPGPPPEKQATLMLPHEPYTRQPGTSLWRTIKIRITRESLDAWLDGTQVIHSYPLRRRVAFHERVLEQLGKTSVDSEALHRGALGLYINESNASFRNFIVNTVN